MWWQLMLLRQENEHMVKEALLQKSKIADLNVAAVGVREELDEMTERVRCRNLNKKGLVLCISGG